VSVVFLAGCGGGDGGDTPGEDTPGVGGGAETGGQSGGSGGDAPTSGGTSPGGGGSPTEPKLAIEPFAKRIASGRTHNCVIEKEGTLYCWGFGIINPFPAEKFAQISAMDEHTCGVTLSGEVKCWIGATAQATPDGGGFVQVAVTSDGACAVQTQGNVTCWARNSMPIGQVVPDGLYTNLVRSKAAILGLTNLGELKHWGTLYEDVEIPEAARSIDGWLAVCWTDASKAVRCSGVGFAETPALKVEQIATGQSMACGLIETGLARCWGLDPYGAPEGARFVELSTGKSHACGITTEGKVLCWGSGGAEAKAPVKDAGSVVRGPVRPVGSLNCGNNPHRPVVNCLVCGEVV
jgi:alpha-tubulin suppressor-like RCC1 family protein